MLAATGWPGHSQNLQQRGTYLSGRQWENPTKVSFRVLSRISEPGLWSRLTNRRILFVQIYLPIAELPVNVLLVLLMGLAVGFISGMFGIGGGFLMTPLLIFIGISPAVAVASVASHVAASSFSGAINYWRRRALDPALAAMLLIGGLIGTTAGVWLFTLLRALGQLDLTIGLSYLVLLGTVGSMMIAESVRAILRARGGRPAEIRRPGSHMWIHGLPLKMLFKV